MLTSCPSHSDYEISFLRLLSKLTNGTHLEISYTGTSLLFRPGILLGGIHTHDVPLSRPVGWFLEPLSQLAPWGKKDLQLTLKGITTGGQSLGVDLIRTFLLPTIQLFGAFDGLELKITKRGAEPGGGGEVYFRCPAVRSVKTLNFVDPGRVKRIRGVACVLRACRSYFFLRVPQSLTADAGTPLP
jgi:RNA 3'-terminal phosphate cyclase-like protein